MENIASTAPAAPSRWPIEDLVDDIVVLAGRVAEQPLDRPQFDLVADRRRGAMGVDIVDLGGRDPGALQRGAHRSETRRRRPARAR